MSLPSFRLYWEDNLEIREKIQPSLEFRSWNSLSISEKEIAYQELINLGWIEKHSENITKAINDLNYHFLRVCPGRNYHKTPAVDSSGYSNVYRQREAAAQDFWRIFHEDSDEIVFRMLSKFCESYIDVWAYNLAKWTKGKAQKDNIERAFWVFDKLSNCLNRIFEQFCVNVFVTRNGFVPRQDKKLSNDIYEPVLIVLSDPKWKSVSDHLSTMFSDFQDKHYAECITKAHGAVQRFLQILVWEEGKNGQWELAKLFNNARDTGIIPKDRFTSSIIDSLQGFLSSERATNSTAKPAKKEATSSDAILVMNVVMIFLQHCLQNSNQK